jgi:hypothetical protein
MQPRTWVEEFPAGMWSVVCDCKIQLRTNDFFLRKGMLNQIIRTSSFTSNILLTVVLVAFVP